MASLPQGRAGWDTGQELFPGNTGDRLERVSSTAALFLDCHPKEPERALAAAAWRRCLDVPKYSIISSIILNQL